MIGLLIINNFYEQKTIQPKDFGCKFAGRNYSLNNPTSYNLIKKDNICSNYINMLC